jgi:hypothetical protein
MTGKSYYLTTLRDWKRRAPTFSSSHWYSLAGQDSERQESGREESTTPSKIFENTDDSARILVLVEADEGIHGSIEDDEAFFALPHPLSQKPIAESEQSEMAPFGVEAGATVFEATEVFSRKHPLLRHRVF